MSDIPKTCRTCAHKFGFTMEFGKCSKTGYYIETSRKYPSKACDINFSGWDQREGIWQRIKSFWWSK